MQIKFALIILGMTCMGAFAGLFIKRASGADNLIKQVFNWNFIIGGLIYFASSVVNVYVLRFVDYSIVYPLTSITYIFTMLVSHFFLKEKITKRKIAGVGLILLGAVMISLF
ncbi:MAG: EamA family transporter [Oscillospiraceae bacterium]|nr:EamA family transporter [Oscillospiraceae bacterium]